MDEKEKITNRMMNDPCVLTGINAALDMNEITKFKDHPKVLRDLADYEEEVLMDHPEWAELTIPELYDAIIRLGL